MNILPLVKVSWRIVLSGVTNTPTSEEGEVTVPCDSECVVEVKCQQRLKVSWYWILFIGVTDQLLEARWLSSGVF